MSEKNKKFFNVQFPIIKNISGKLLGDSIEGMSAEETSIAMQKMFDNFEAMTGLKPNITGNKSPIRVLLPKNK